MPFFTSGIIPTPSSSSSSAISSEVRDDAACISCACSDIDCRDTEELSVLLLSNCVLLVECEALPGRADWPEARGVGIPVMSRFLKLSTSSEALLLPGVGLCAFVRSSVPLSPCRGSNDASVFENGFTGALPGIGAPCDPLKYVLVLGNAPAVTRASFPITCALASPAVIEWLVKPAGFTGGGGLAGRPPWLARRAMSSLSVTLLSSSKLGGGGMVVVGETMRTDFFVFVGAAASSSTVRKLLLQCQQKQNGKAREYHGRCLPGEPRARCYLC